MPRPPFVLVPLLHGVRKESDGTGLSDVGWSIDLSGLKIMAGPNQPRVTRLRSELLRNLPCWLLSKELWLTPKKVGWVGLEPTTNALIGRWFPEYASFPPRFTTLGDIRLPGGLAKTSTIEVLQSLSGIYSVSQNYFLEHSVMLGRLDSA